MKATRTTTNSTITVAILTTVLSVLLILGTACSSGDGESNPLVPGEMELTSNLSAQTSDGMGVAGIYQFTFDPESLTLDFERNREAETYINVTPFVWDHYVDVTITSWDFATGTLEFDMEIENPTAYDVYDVRALWIVDGAESSRLTDANDYTEHYNAYSSHERIPFRSYCRTEATRIFAAGTSHSEPFDVLLDGPPYTFEILIAACIPDYTEEPYAIRYIDISNPISSTQSATISLDVRDHQDNVEWVRVYTTEFNGGYIPLINSGGDTWESQPFHNDWQAAPGIYRCWITASSENTDWHLYDLIEIEVIEEPWTKMDYALSPDGSSLDLGVIGNPGGTLEGQILMADADAWPGDSIQSYYPDYSGSYSYIPSLNNLDPSNSNYAPWPVTRIDAAAGGAFSITNDNPDCYRDIFGDTYFNNQVWSVFDSDRKLYIDPSPNSSRYVNVTLGNRAAYPVDVCDDFDGGQYALFTTEGNVCGKDLFFVGTMPDKYTHGDVQYIGDLDAWIGSGAGMVDPANVAGIDVYTLQRADQFSAMLYILVDEPSGMHIEVFQVYDDASNLAKDSVSFVDTITLNMDYIVTGYDIELLPENSAYSLNPDFPTVAVLTGLDGPNYDFGTVCMFNSYTGDFLEELSSYFGSDPMFENCTLHHLDVDDGNWQIHMTWEDEGGDPYASVFTKN